jgi:hypothetical protein
MKRASRFGFRTWSPASRRVTLLVAALPPPDPEAPPPMVGSLSDPGVLGADALVVTYKTNMTGTLVTVGSHVISCCTSSMCKP